MHARPVPSRGVCLSVTFVCSEWNEWTYLQILFTFR